MTGSKNKTGNKVCCLTTFHIIIISCISNLTVLIEQDDSKEEVKTKKKTNRRKVEKVITIVHFKICCNLFIESICHDMFSKYSFSFHIFYSFFSLFFRKRTQIKTMMNEHQSKRSNTRTEKGLKRCLHLPKIRCNYSRADKKKG